MLCLESENSKPHKETPAEKSLVSQDITSQTHFQQWNQWWYQCKFLSSTQSCWIKLTSFQSISCSHWLPREGLLKGLCCPGWTEGLQWFWVRCLEKFSV
jgi:hypothetical protein